MERLFRKDSRQQNAQSKTSEEMRADPDLIQLYDEYGREMFIDKQTWRKDVLPGTLKDNWNKPDDLYGIIVSALNDGFYADVTKAAQHLYKIDSIPDRASCILGIVLLKNGKLDEAEAVLNRYLSEYGEEGAILTNIAKVQAARGQHDLAEKTLLRALEVDPNQDNAVGWWAAIHHERYGDSGYIQALEKVAAFKGSWRAQLWLARVSLEKREYEKARQYYDAILATLEVVPADVMMQISGDLGNAGRLADIVELLEHRFDPELHGLMAGNNLIKAHIDLQTPERARKVLAKLYKLDRPDWKEHLQFWENQIDQASGRYGSVDNEIEMSVTALSLDWPVWAHKLSSFDRLLPGKKDSAPTISFISSSCEYQNMPEQRSQQKADKEGNLSRAIPLFLAERVHMVSDAKAIMLVPVTSGEGSFVLGGRPWEIDALIEMASDSKANFIFGGHLVAKGKQWQYYGTFVDVSKNAVAEEFSIAISEEDPGEDVIKLSERVRDVLCKHCKLKKEVAPIEYQLPRPEIFNAYLDAISHSLALSVAAANECGGNSLYGERPILDYLLDLALDDTNSDVTRLMFVGALAKNKAYGSDVYWEYQKKVEKLLADYPLSGIAAEVCNETLASLYSNAM